MPNQDFLDASRCYDLERFEEASEIAQRGVQRFPDDPDCFFILALNAARLKKWRQARELLEAARTRGASPELIFFYSSRVCGNLGDWVGAEANIIKALTLQPQRAFLHFQYAIILKARRKLEASLTEIDIALSLDPQLKGALKFKVKLLTVMGRKNEAEELGRFLLGQNPDSSDPHAAVGFVALRQGNVDEALSAFREALRINPNSGEAKRGVMESLKSKFVIYRWNYAWQSWCESKPMIPFAILPFLVGRAYGAIPEPVPLPVVLLFTALLLLFTGFFLFKVFANQIANVLLMFHPLGRMLLDVHVKAETGWFFGSLTLLTIAAAGLLISHDTLWWVIILTCGLTCFVMNMMSRASERGAARWVMFATFAAISLGFVGFYIRPLV